MAGDAAGQPQLGNAQLRIALLTVADDEQAVRLRQLFHRLPDAGVADMAGVFVEVAVFRLHAPRHQGVALFFRKVGKDDVGDLRHHPAEQGLQGLRRDAVPGKPFLFQLDVVPLRHQRPGIPQGAVNVKNQALVIHASSKCRWMRPMIISSATRFFPPSGTTMLAYFLLGSTYRSCMGLTVS